MGHKPIFPFYYSPFPRKKILAVTTTKKAVLDPEHPEILEEARWWVNVLTKRTRKEKDRATMTATAQVNSTPEAIGVLTSSLSTPSVAPTGAIDMSKVLALVNGGRGFKFNQIQTMQFYVFLC